MGADQSSPRGTDKPAASLHSPATEKAPPRERGLVNHEGLPGMKEKANPSNDSLVRSRPGSIRPRYGMPLTARPDD